MVLCLAGGLASAAQDAPAPQPGQIKDPRAVLAAAAPFYDFSDPSLKPFHIKATYQLYDDKGSPSEQGTFEYWWVSPQVHRTTWTRPSAMHTTWYLADGKEAYATSGEDLGYFERQLPADFFSPISASKNAIPSTTILLRNALKLGGNEFVCISRDFNETSEREQPFDFRSLPTQCFDSVLPTLRFGIDGDGVVATAYDDIIKFQGKFLARSIDIRTRQQTLFTVKVDAIDGVKPSDPVLVPPASAIAEIDPVAPPPGPVMPGRLLKKSPPRYPANAKRQGVQGTVIIDAIISADGKVKNPHVIGSPSPLLSDAGIEAVSKWQYAPSMVNGVPVEGAVIIDVIFTLGGPSLRPPLFLR